MYKLWRGHHVVLCNYRVINKSNMTLHRKQLLHTKLLHVSARNKFIFRESNAKYAKKGNIKMKEALSFQCHVLYIFYISLS
jgi:hypothetical protein